MMALEMGVRVSTFRRSSQTEHAFSARCFATCSLCPCRRLGSGRWWGFEGEGVIPDMVSVGKPLGNGHPVSALCVRRSVARAFDECGMEYFNTFGGNTVSVAAALETLREIERMDLPRNCDVIGGRLMKGFKDVQARYPGTVGDVRGSGLFLGIEIISSDGLGGEETSWLCSQLKDVYRVLTTIDGEHDNVIVVKPPQTFGAEEADYYIWTFGEALKDLKKEKTAGTWVSGGKTPT